MMPRDAERGELVSQAAESRAHPRVKIHSLAYIELGEANAGLILNISESGIAIQSVEALSSASFPRMQFRLPKTDALIQVAGKVVWQIKPKKEAGIEFESLSEQTRLAIRKWIAAEEGRQEASEKAHLKPLSDPLGSAGQKTAVQVYPSERGDEETVAVIPDVPFNPAEFAPVPAEISRPQNRGTPARAASALQPPLSMVPPRAPTRIPDRWRTVPQGSSAHGAQPSSILGRQNQIFGTSAWNLAANARVDSKHRRSRWPYFAAIVLLGAVGVAGMMALDPGAMNTASIAAIVDRLTASLKHYPPAQTSSSAETAPAAQSQPGANSLTASANTSSPAQASQAPPTTQPEAPTALPQNTLAAPQPSAAGAVPPNTQQPTAQAGDQNAQNAPNAADDDSSPTDVQDGATNPPDQAQSQPAALAAPSSAARSPQPTQQDRAGEYARNNQPAASPKSTTSSSRENMPAANRTSSQQTVATNSRTSNSQNQTAAQRRNDQSALEAWRAQTELSAGSANSAARRPRRAPVAQENVQDAYARSAPYVTSRAANAPENYTAQQQVSLVDVPGYRSAAAPTSMPLAGVPSGSVAATSQFRAIWVPARLTWARQYLPGNLGVGQLLSSYSPAYPIQAAREEVEGTVKLDVTVGMDGTVRTVRVLSGPPMLSSAAVAAVRDWRYAETFLAGDPVETQQYVTMFFRLAPAR